MPGTSAPRPTTQREMDCDTAQEALSAAADGEDPGVAVGDLDRHLAGCPDCAAFADLVDRSNVRRLPVAVPDRTFPAAVARTSAAADRAGVHVALRAALGVVALVIMVRTAPVLLSAQRHTAGHDGAAYHDQRHLGSLSVAYAVALMMVALRPARARLMLPLAAVTAVALAVTTVLDAAEGHIPIVGQLVYLPEMLSVGLVWWIARSVTRRTFGDDAQGRTTNSSTGRPASASTIRDAARPSP